jgi:predicted Zn-dependent protease
VVKEALKRAGAQLMQSAYTQDQELEVDAFGFRLAHSAGFDPAGGIRLLERLAATPHDDDAMPLAEYFASHPPMETRIDILRRLRRTE